MLEAIFRIVIYMFRVTRTAESYGFDSRLHDQNREVWNPKASLPKITSIALHCSKAVILHNYQALS